MDTKPTITRRDNEANRIANEKRIKSEAISKEVAAIGVYLIDPCILFAYDDPFLRMDTGNEQ